MVRQNPPVLPPLEMLCSARKHPLSSGSGRKRYNTLDFARQNRVPTGRFRPYWKPRIKGICHPFAIPARFRICVHKPKNGFVTANPETQKIPGESLLRKEESSGDFLCRIH